MIPVTDIYNLIKELMNEAEKVKNDSLYSSLINIEKQVYDMDMENRKLKEQLDIRNNSVYDEKTNVYILPNKPNIKYCAVCYGSENKLIPINNGKCRKCEENWIRINRGK